MDALQRRLRRARSDLKSGAVENLLALKKSAASGKKSVWKVSSFSTTSSVGSFDKLSKVCMFHAMGRPEYERLVIVLTKL